MAIKVTCHQTCGDILEAVRFAERTMAMYAAGSEKRGHLVAAARYRQDAARFAKASQALTDTSEEGKQMTSKYHTQFNVRPERSLNDQLSARESTLIYNALLEKAKGDREAAATLDGRDHALMRDRLREQADMAEKLAEEFI